MLHHLKVGKCFTLVKQRTVYITCHSIVHHFFFWPISYNIFQVCSDIFFARITLICSPDFIEYIGTMRCCTASDTRQRVAHACVSECSVSASVTELHTEGVRYVITTSAVTRYGLHCCQHHCTHVAAGG
jgi:hypothetical protein